MKKLTFTGKLIDYERRNNSPSGNPKYYGIFENEKGETLEATTAADASCGYSFLNHKENKRTITYHVKKQENVLLIISTFTKIRRRF